MKRFEILYNPYNNRIHFRQELAKEDSDDYEWAEIESDSQLHKFQGSRCIFENCVEEILDLINKYFNTSGELAIEFIGTDEDFGVLKLAIERSDNPKSKGIITEISEQYPSSSDALKKIRGAYEQIKTEFDDYIDNDFIEKLYKTITKTKSEVVKARFKVGDKYYIKGKNFTEMSKITLDDTPLETVYLSSNLLGLLQKVDPADASKMKVSQIDRNTSTIISTTE